MVDRLVYIDEFVKRKVFASTMSFMFGSNLKCVLPKNDHDLRRHLEKHLMNNPNLLNDYDAIGGNVQALFEQKKAIAETTKLEDEFVRGIESNTENRRLKAEAVGKSLKHIFVVLSILFEYFLFSLNKLGGWRTRFEIVASV